MAPCPGAGGVEASAGSCGNQAVGMKLQGHALGGHVCAHTNKGSWVLENLTYKTAGRKHMPKQASMITSNLRFARALFCCVRAPLRKPC
jgi:hypothetical protein